jgi:hypothetical protein
LELNGRACSKVNSIMRTIKTYSRNSRFCPYLAIQRL